MKYSILLLCSLCVILLFESCTKDVDLHPEEGITVLDAFDQEMLELVNETRTTGCDCGGKYMPAVGELRWDNRIEEAARKHSEDQEAQNLMSHKGSDGSNVGERLSREDYEWKSCGENVAFGYKTPKEVLEGWLNSPSHCENLMWDGYKEMGAAKSAKNYWTQIFAIPD